MELCAFGSRLADLVLAKTLQSSRQPRLPPATLGNFNGHYPGHTAPHRMMSGLEISHGPTLKSAIPESAWWRHDWLTLPKIGNTNAI